MSERNIMTINCDYQFRDVVISAFRYAVGRNTYIVDEICEWIEQHPEVLDNRMVNVMIRDVEEQLTWYEHSGVNSITEIDYKRLQNFRGWLATYYLTEKIFDNIEV